MDLNGKWFVDSKTKSTVLFKGINMGAGTKLPVGLASHDRKDFWVDYDRHVSFVGRPFPLHEADEHLQRLVNYGFNLLRFVITWEAIEHEGPGIYDEDYLNYVIELLKKCKEYQLKVFIDPHQDCWSRHCGGSGHPGWTLLLAGLNPVHFPETEAAIVHNLYPQPKQFPKMIWNTNYQKLAAATLFTLFFAGKDYAPKCRVNGVHVQDYLQQHYLDSIAQLVQKIHTSGLENDVVIGYDSMNEPGQGYLPFYHLDKLLTEDTDFKLGFMPTPFEGMLLGSGLPTKPAYYEFKWNGPQKTGHRLIEPRGKSAWLNASELEKVCNLFGWKREWPAGCIWETHGVWSHQSKKLLLPHYFAAHPKTGQPTNYTQYWLSHLEKYIQMIRKIHKEAILFAQPPVLEVPPQLPGHLAPLVYAPHWYDGLTLVKKKWCSYNVDFINLQRGKYGHGPLRFLYALRLGDRAIRQGFVDQLKTIQKEGNERIGDYPCLIGEIGIPFDMVNEDEDSTSIFFIFRFFTFILNWVISFFRLSQKTITPTIQLPQSSQNKALDANFNALEKNLLNYTLWQYQPDNHPVWGDQWNGEDLSIWQNSSHKTPPDLNVVNMFPTTSNVSLVDETLISNNLSNITTEEVENIKKHKMKEPLKENQIRTGTYLNRSANSSTDSFQGLLKPKESNERDLICLYRPHPYNTSGIPISIEFISPTETLVAIFEYQFHYKPIESTTEIHVPNRFFPIENTKISLSVGKSKVKRTNERYWILECIIGETYEINLVKLKLEGVNYTNKLFC